MRFSALGPAKGELPGLVGSGTPYISIRKKVCDNQRREGKLMEVIREEKEDEEEDERARESAMNL